MRIAAQIVLGIAILIIVLAALLGVAGSVQIPGVILGYVAPVVSGVLNVVLLAAIAGLVTWGVIRSKPGLALAPVAFAALWIGAAVVSQWRVQTSIDPAVLNRPISPEARAQRTLIMQVDESVDRKIIADGHIDRLIKVEREYSSHRLMGIEELSLARGDACSAEEKRAALSLRRAGRSDECFKSRSLAEIPDGLVVEQIVRIKIGSGETGCCNEAQARLRSGGKERVLFSWRQGQAYVLSYFPVFNLYFAPATRLWEAGSGITHPVRYGVEDIAPITMISALYGVTPAYRVDTSWSLPRPVLSATEARDQAETFAKQGNVSPKSVGELLIAARDKGLVDDRSIEIAVSLVGHDSEGWNAVTNFAKGLTSEQTEVLLGKVLERLETPNICEDCVVSQRLVGPSLRDWKLRERLSNADAVYDRAIRIFAERHDLAAWQYEGCLRIITSLALSRQGYPVVDDVQKSVLPLLLADDTPAYSDKAIAYLRAGFERPTIAEVKLAAKLDLVRDRDVEEYLTSIWIWQLNKLPQRNASAEKYAIATRACERIARMSDPALRKQNFGVDCPVRSR
jgi:hypothetical protein